MIQHPVLLALVLTGIVAMTIAFSKTRAGVSFFKFLPVPFYCYFLPILGATLGLFPETSPLYKWASQHVLPPCLVLLLIGSPWGELVRLGRQAILAMVIGTLGMMAGSFAAYAALADKMPDGSWMAAGALLGSWTGGSANMMAVKEALNMPEQLLAPLIIVDTAIAYSWMALLIALAGRQIKIDSLLNADRTALVSAIQSAGSSKASLNSGTRWAVWIPLGILSVAIGELSLRAGAPMAQAIPGLSPMAWTVILATTAGLALSLTPLRRWEDAGASTAGIHILLLLLTTYGAQTNLRAILNSPAFMGFGAIMVLIHGIVLLIAGRVFRLPLFYLATASQACIGGPVSTPIVAGVYQPSLTHVGVILALLGGAVGTYVGLLGAAVCRWLGS